MPLEVRDLRATQEDVLSSTCCGLLLLNLDFHDLGRMLNDLRDVSPVTRADFTKDTLVDPDNSSDKPVTLLVTNKEDEGDVRSHSQFSWEELVAYPEDTNSVKRAVWRPVRLDHAEHSMKLPVDEEYDEQMVRIPEAFEVSTTTLLNREPNHDAKSNRHNPSRRTRAGREVRRKEGDDALSRVRRVRVCHCELVEVDHVSSNVHEREEDNRPGGGFVERNVLVKGDHVVQGRSAKHGDEVPADR